MKTHSKHKPAMHKPVMHKPTKRTTTSRSRIRQNATQKSSQKARAAQSESQNLLVRNSEKVTVRQTSTEMLTTTQKALNAAIQTIIATAKSKNIDIDQRALQRIMQDLNSRQTATQKTQIIGSTDVRIEQDETEQSRLLQQAMNLLEECIRKM